RCRRRNVRMAIAELTGRESMEYVSLKQDLRAAIRESPSRTLRLYHSTENGRFNPQITGNLSIILIISRRPLAFKIARLQIGTDVGRAEGNRRTGDPRLRIRRSRIRCYATIALDIAYLLVGPSQIPL